MQHRIRWRIVTPCLLLLVVVISLFTIFMVNHILQKELERWQTQLLRTAKLIASDAQEAIINPGGNDLQILAKSKSKILELDVTFIEATGKILGTSIPIEQQMQNALDMPTVSQALAEGQGSHIEDDWIAAAVTFQSPNGDLLGVVQLQAPLSYFRLDLSRFIWLAGAFILVGGLGILLLGYILHDLSREPVETLTIAARQMSMGNFNNLEFPEAPHELSELSQTLQVMAQKLGEQIDALTSEKAKLSAVLNQMADGVLITDADGRVQLLNPTAERLFQIEEKVGLGRSVVEVMRYHQLVDLWREAKKGQRQSMMLEIGPQHLFLQVVAIPLKTALPGSTMLLFQDLTQLRRLETVRRDFISNVSHELRTPLASLKALAETLQEGALDDPPAARRFIIRMETEIDNLTQLVNELLELSRIESGKVPLSFQRAHPCGLLKPAYERMALQAERAELELVLDCPPELPIVFADPDRISQVLINLVHNAIKFTPPEGKITLSAYRDEEYIVLYVRDTGVGIPKKDLTRIFERFYKADQARAGGGTGLGLSIARHMIESHGGYIWVESEEDTGSTFYFTLPIA
jgi:two-component system, OmpR family, phosphate regulon sensor histidine kinase PhoR